MMVSSLFCFHFRTEMDRDSFWKLRFDSKTVKQLFDFEIKHTPESEDRFCKSLLESVHLDDLLEEVRALSGTLVLQRTIPITTKQFEAGTIFVFEVDVFSEKGLLQLSERVCI